MRTLVKFVCVALFLLGRLYAMPDFGLYKNRNKKHIHPNTIIEAMWKLKAHEDESKYIKGYVASMPADATSRSAILAQTQENAPTTEARSLIYISSVGGLACGERGLIGYRGLSGRSSNPWNLSPEERQMFDEEHQALLAQLYAMNGTTLFARTQIHDISHIALNKADHFPTDPKTTAVSVTEHLEDVVRADDLIQVSVLTQPSEKMISAEHEGDLVDEEAIANPNSSYLTFTDYEIEETPAAEDELTAAISPVSRKLVIYYGNSSERRIHKVKLPL